MFENVGCLLVISYLKCSVLSLVIYRFFSVSFCISTSLVCIIVTTFGRILILTIECLLVLSSTNWNGNALSWGSETTIEVGNWIETKETFTRPIVVEAEMKAAVDPECISMNLFATNHEKNAKYSLETGGWQNKIRLFPGDYQETVGYNHYDWDAVRIELTNDTVLFYLNGALKYSVADASRTNGSLQFVAGCTAMKVRNPRIVPEGRCPILNVSAGMLIYVVQNVVSAQYF